MKAWNVQALMWLFYRIFKKIPDILLDRNQVDLYSHKLEFIKI